MTQLIDKLSALLACVMFVFWIGADSAALDAPASNGREQAAPHPAQATAGTRRREVVFGAYGGATYTHPSEVRVVNPGKTDMRVGDVEWIGRPFKSPIYYGLRAQVWPAGLPFGAMLDFTHAKAIAQFAHESPFAGTRNGRPLPSKAKVGDVFKHLEFSHGHNLLTLNGLLRLPLAAARVRPYIGAGGGILLPHTEVGFRDEKTRTYEYQYGGIVGQLLAGIEVPLGRASVFLEYKFTPALYDVPLSHEPYGWLLVTDLWRQMRAWIDGEAPPGGRLATRLLTHHGIGGIYVRVGAPRINPAAP